MMKMKAPTLTSNFLHQLIFASCFFWGTGANSIATEIGALGYIAPKDKIVFLVGTPGVEIAEIKIKAHQRVKKGQILMVFSNYAQLNTRKALASLELKNQSALGPERIKIQEAKIHEAQRLQERTEKHLENYSSLSIKAQVITELTRRKQNLVDARHQLDVQSLLLSQVNRESELGISQARLKLKLAKTLLARGKLVAPRDGVILEIRKQVGETIGGQPALLLADDSSMYVVSDVYESDLLKIDIGMLATITSNSLPKALSGKIERVNQVIDTASRLGKVLIKLDNTELASKLIGLEVHVVIHN